MGETFILSQSSILLPRFQYQAWRHGRHSLSQNHALPSRTSAVCLLATKSLLPPTICAQPLKSSGFRVNVVSDSKTPTTFTVDSAGEGIDILPDTGGGNDDFGGASGGGGGGNNDGNNNEGKGESDESEDHSGGSSKRKTAISMSQKLTLGYAFLVGMGGLMGYLKGGSQKSLIAGGVSASLLCFVYAFLPASPVFASSMGFGVSAALLWVMGSRFLRSRKIFPVGIVSFVSLIMSGGYIHGILRSLH